MVGSKLGWSAFLVACASLATVAMPTKSDFQKVQLAVDELLEADRAAVKAGKMKPVNPTFHVRLGGELFSRRNAA